MSRRRLERVNQLLREELSRLILSEVKDPRVSTATVTRVETTPDLMHATVFVRTLSDDVVTEEAIAGLESAEGFIRGRLSRELRLRRIPDFRFRADHSLEHVERIESLLEEALGPSDVEDQER
jgi:ribosome-binding factor A